MESKGRLSVRTVADALGGAVCATAIVVALGGLRSSLAQIIVVLTISFGFFLYLKKR